MDARIVVALAAALLVSSGSERPAWEEAFPPSSGRSWHYRAVRRDAHGVHRVESWRDGDRSVRRRMDRVEITATPGDGDWEALTRVIERPRGEARLRRLGDGDGCRWVRVDDPPAFDVCWSERWGVPLRIRQGRLERFVIYAIDEPR